METKARISPTTIEIELGNSGKEQGVTEGDFGTGGAEATAFVSGFQPLVVV